MAYTDDREGRSFVRLLRPLLFLVFHPIIFTTLDRCFKLHNNNLFVIYKIPIGKEKRTFQINLEIIKEERITALLFSLLLRERELATVA